MFGLRQKVRHASNDSSIGQSKVALALADQLSLAYYSAIESWQLDTNRVCFLLSYFSSTTFKGFRNTKCHPAGIG